MENKPKVLTKEELEKIKKNKDKQFPKIIKK